MKTFVLTRSAYGPAWDIAANRRRLAVTQAVTARLMAAQTDRDWTWVVLLDPRDPLIEERQTVFAAAAPQFVPVLWTPPSSPQAAPWDRRAGRPRAVDRIAAEAYKAPWLDAITDRSGLLIQVRLDDDDGLAPTALARYRAAAPRCTKRTILMLPAGVRVWKGRYSVVRHERNAMHALVTTPRDAMCVYDYAHAKCQRAAPIVLVDQEWGWLWARHQDTLSGWKRADRPIDAKVRQAFPIDWRLLR